MVFTSVALSSAPMYSRNSGRRRRGGVERQQQEEEEREEAGCGHGASDLRNAGSHGRRRRSSIGWRTY